MEIEAGSSLSMQWQTNVLAVLGEGFITTWDVEAGTPSWRVKAPAGAHQVVWSYDRPLLFVATTGGDVWWLDRETGATVGHKDLGPGICWVAPQHHGRTEAIRGVGELVRWSEKEPAVEVWRKTHSPVVAVLGKLHIEEGADGDRIATNADGKHRRAMSGTFCSNGEALLVLNEAGGLRSITLWDQPDGTPKVIGSWQLPAGQVRAIRRGAATERLYLLRDDGVALFLIPPGKEAVSRGVLGVRGATVVIESIDGTWVAATGPHGGQVVRVRSLESPRARKPRLKDLRTMTDLLDGSAKWVFPPRDIEESVDALLPRSPDLATLAPPVRIWWLSYRAESAVQFDGLMTAILNDRDQAERAAEALEALALLDAASTWRRAIALFDAYPEDDIPPFPPFEPLEKALVRQLRGSVERRMALLREHPHAFIDAAT